MLSSQLRKEMSQYGKSNFFFALCVIWIMKTLADIAIDCSNEEIVTSLFNDPIPLDFNGTIRLYKNVIIDGLLNTSNSEFEVKYIDARLSPKANKINDSQDLMIFTTENFLNYAKEQTATRITLKIVLACGEGRERTVVFFQPIRDGNYFRPVFSSDTYEIWLPTPIFEGFDLTYFVEISARDDDLINNQVTFTSLNAADHYIKVGTKNITSTNSKKFLASLILDNVYLSFKDKFQFQIIATDNGIPQLSAKAEVIVYPDAMNQLPLFPEFEKSVYFTSLNSNFTMDPLRISLINGSYTNDITYYMNGSDAAFFSIQYSSTDVVISLAEKLSVSDIETKSFLEVDIQAFNPKLSNYGRTVIIILLPNIMENFHFVLNVYEGVIDSAGNLDIETVKFEPTAYTPDIRFELRGKHSTFFKLVQDANVLSLNFTSRWTDTFLIDNLLILELIATKGQHYTSTIIFIKVSNQESTVVGPVREHQESYGLIIKEVEEEQKHSAIMPMIVGECRHQIETVYPNDKSYVFINQTTNMLSTVAIDREDEIFANMSVPQVRVELKLICPGRKKRALGNLDFSEIIAKDIPNGSGITVLNLIILDINDNPPIFKQPSKSPYYIGYPESSVCFELFPQNLFQAIAIDLDVGLNAEIRYSIEPDLEFGIDAMTGVIYPKIGFGAANVTELIVTATDRAGALDGLSTSIFILIKRLTADNIMLLTYDTNEVESLSKTLHEFSENTHLQFHTIKSAILPIITKSTQRILSPRYDEEFMQQAWIYAFEDGETVLCSDIQEMLNDVTNMTHTSFIVESFEEVGLNSNYGDDIITDNSQNLINIVYLIIIAVLTVTNAVLLCLILRYSKVLNCCTKPAMTITPTTCETNYAIDSVISCTHTPPNFCNKCRTNSLILSSEPTYDPEGANISHNIDVAVELQSENTQNCAEKLHETKKQVQE